MAKARGIPPLGRTPNALPAPQAPAYLPMAKARGITQDLVMCNDQGEAETVTDVITLNKNHQHIEHLGLTLAESKQLLSTLQRHLLQQQVNTFLDTCADCPDCGTPLHLKAHSRR